MIGGDEGCVAAPAFSSSEDEHRTEQLPDPVNFALVAIIIIILKLQNWKESYGS